MNIHRISFIPFFLFLTLNLNAQDAIPASGGDALGSGGSAAYSVGQVSYTHTNSTSGSSNQGVQQPYVLLATNTTTFPDINLSMIVYPNPSVTSINLNVGNQSLENLSFQLFDVQGKLLQEKKINLIDISIKMEEYNSGNYLLKVLKETSELKTFKIIKN
jgi:hypothetical protein